MAAAAATCRDGERHRRRHPLSAVEPAEQRRAAAALPAPVARRGPARSGAVAQCARRAAGNGRRGARDEDWLGNEAQLAEMLQTARDQLFPHAEQDPRSAAVLLHVVELRDLMLASRLDLELLGEDPVGQRMRAALVNRLKALAALLEEYRDAVLDERVPSSHGVPVIEWEALSPQDPRRRLQLVLQAGCRIWTGKCWPSAARSTARIRCGDGARSRAASALRDPGRLADGAAQGAASPGLAGAAARAAQRVGAVRGLLHRPHAPVGLSSALAGAVGGGRAARHLDQTLERRNMRVLGTAIGCGLMVAIAQIHNLTVTLIVLQIAVGIAHAFVTRRYLITAIAATVMALLQSHLADPSHAMAISERLADTVFGAALAWAFSYVLPAWERRNLPRALKRARGALQHLLRRSQDLVGDTIEEMPEAAKRLQRALAGKEPVPHAVQALQDWSLLPEVGPLEDLRPWMRRRMQVSLDDAARAGQAAEAALDAMSAPPDADAPASRLS
ncbi:fusaric acid resistance protein-like domain-containing protein [Ditylenchus destructor]|nr:fusaric acid resistance protein-like domain-containing protein [Ditylenchus destructor]